MARWRRKVARRWTCPQVSRRRTEVLPGEGEEEEEREEEEEEEERERRREGGGEEEVPWKQRRWMASGMAGCSPEKSSAIK
jgi:hypothetical protein